MTRRDFSLLALGSIPLAERLSAVGPEHGGAMLDYLREYARLLDERRRQRFALIGAPENVDALRQQVREKLREMWGPLPTDESPLNPQILGTLERDGLTVEKILFESRPGFLVPANLYRPSQSSERLPAVIVACGHDPLGKASELTQRFCALLARHGMIGLAYDPVGCGERPQFASGSAAERQRALAIHCTSVGLNLMNYRAWDCRRAVDYLEQLPDVDPRKIAIAGDGAEALEYAAFDQRIAASFPTGQVVSFKAFIDAAVISDPERVLYGSLRDGIEHVELLACMAPHPLVVGAPQRGLLSTEATADTFNQAMRAYRAAGSPEVASLVDANEVSALGPDIRRAGVDWLSRWLSPVSRTVIEEFGQLFSVDELRCGPLDGLQTKTVVDLNRERAAHLAPLYEVPAETSRFEVYKHGIRQRIKDVSRVGSFLPERGIEITDRTIDAGRYVQGVAVVLSDRGREDPWLRRAVIDPIVAAQFSVVALDLRGWGAGAPAAADEFDWENFFADSSLQIGRPLLGQRMKDLLAIPATRIGRRSWTLVGVGDAALVAAQAAAIDDRVDRLITVNGLLSFNEALDDPLTAHPMSSFPPGIIGQYDVRDIYAAVGPRPVLALNPVDSQRQAVQEVQAWERFDWISQAYENIGAPNGFQMHSQLDSPGLRKAITAWLQS
ncbi:MAG: hypothetical protein O3A53_14200 [Acidobacteria bacterium]|nr:hypothetical protein [Acidobacteriota bacterium]MDA1235939.1 hypothetical protein [Acidobacteriota bacterium]